MRFIVIALLLSACLVHAGPKRIAVFVALCDNASQGIVPVPAKIGNGDKPADNLYWGCDDGLSSCFRASKSWKLVRKDAPNDHRILERLIFQSTDGTMELVAEAWRGKEIGSCIKAFENALISGQHDLCAYIGHNVLMDYAITPPATKATQPCDAIVLCCKSEPYFKTRLEGCSVPKRGGAKRRKMPTTDQLWDKYYTAAPARRRQCVGRSNIVKRA